MYEYHLNWWGNVAGKYFLSDLSPTLIAEYRDKLLNEVIYRNAKRSWPSIYRFLASPSTACTSVVKEWQWLEENSVLKVSKFPETRDRGRFLFGEEPERLLTACRNSLNLELNLAVIIALLTGARRMKLWSQKWNDVFLDKGFLYFADTKNGAPYSHESRS